MKTNQRFWLYLVQFFEIMLQTKVVQKIKTHIFIQQSPPPESRAVDVWDNVEKQGRAGQATYDITAHALCMPNT